MSVNSSPGHRSLTLALWTVVVASAVIASATACGGHVYDPDVDGQSHWWSLCKEDEECGAGLSCVCGSCSQACDERSACGDARVCVAPPAWCESRVSAACAATCERATDCPVNSRCDDAVCVPLPAPASDTSTSNPNASDAASASDAGTLTSNDAARSSDAAVSSCGDGIVQTESFEECDDANDVERDGCSPACTLEPSYACAADAGVCFSVCGDGVLSPNEDCDDGNGVGTDGCSSRCTIEPGYECTLPGAPCVDHSSP